VTNAHVREARPRIGLVVTLPKASHIIFIFLGIGALSAWASRDELLAWVVLGCSAGYLVLCPLGHHPTLWKGYSKGVSLRGKMFRTKHKLSESELCSKTNSTLHFISLDLI